MDLLEREQFLEELEAIFAEVVGGHGQFVLVSGEAGIGKTSLVEWFVETHQEQARLLWGACDALFTPRPLGPLYDIAPKAQSNLLTLLEDEAPRASILAAVLEEMDGRTPSIFVIEDIHWADEATLDLLKFLGRRVNRVKSMIVATYRDDEVGADHPLTLVLGNLPHRSISRLRLPPLSEAGVNTLAARVGRHSEDLFEVTGGNPFFVTEALASKTPGVPNTVRDAVISRARRLSPSARAVLELVSITPARTEMWLLDEAGTADPSSLDECVNSGMLQCDDDAVAFRHELARLAIEDSLALSRRRSLHVEVLQTLLKRDSEALLARIVHHATHAGDPAAVLKYAPLAARQAAALNAHRESASHYNTALQHAAALAPEERAALFESRSYECFLSDQVEDAFSSRRNALEIWKELGNRQKQGDNLRFMSRLAWFLGRKAEAENCAVEAVRILEDLGPSVELAMAYSNRSQLHMLADESQDAIVWGSRAIELAEKLGATEPLAHALNNVGSAQLVVGNEEGRFKLEESLRLALANGLYEYAARAYTNLADAELRLRNYQRARPYLDDCISYATESGFDAARLYMIAERARAYFEQGDWESAAEEAGYVLSQYRVSPISRIPALAVLGHLRVRRGDPDAERLLNEAQELATQTGELQRVGPVASARAELAWLKGHLEQLRPELTSVLEMARSHRDRWVEGEFAFWIWRAGGAPQTHERIAAPYALHMSGDWRAAANAWKEIGCPYEEAVALADGDESAKRDALEIFERLGAGPAAEKLRQTLRATGARGIPRGPRPSTKENPSGLTNRQLEVLTLMADGLGNAEIGDRLFISAKTVDHHVSAILSKLEVRTRGEAVAVASQAGLINHKRTAT
ncbi:MAG TPA: AAA family ATPase [Pyrinomonadaceae bacterium]|nr:AAA family ATPase [Pyrinomonadaceae bacterium]